MEDDSAKDLENQLKSFSISSAEERIANELANTHIGSRTMFGNASTSITFSTSPPPPTQPTHSEQKKKESDGWGDSNGEGWGDGPPSYTSLIQGTYFGFNSIMEAPQEVSKETSTPQQSQAFNKYKNKQATFSSALHDLDNK